MFVTAYDEYAVAAFDEGAVDYLLKPPDPRAHREGRRAAEGALAGGAARPHGAAREARTARGGAAPLKWIRASLGASMRMIAVDDVLYFQAGDKYTRVITADGEALIRKPIKELYDELDPETFWQIHRGTIVNLRAIARVRARLARRARDRAPRPRREARRQPHVRAPLQVDVAAPRGCRRRRPLRLV